MFFSEPEQIALYSSRTRAAQPVHRAQLPRARAHSTQHTPSSAASSRTRAQDHFATSQEKHKEISACHYRHNQHTMSIEITPTWLEFKGEYPWSRGQPAGAASRARRGTGAPPTRGCFDPCSTTRKEPITNSFNHSSTHRVVHRVHHHKEQLLRGCSVQSQNDCPKTVCIEPTFCSAFWTH